MEQDAILFVLGYCKTHKILIQKIRLCHPLVQITTPPPPLDGGRQARVGERGGMGGSVSVDNTFRNSVWAGEEGDGVCA